jgi:hypothetical protein
LPRKYRPPAARRRKNRATNIPYQTAGAPDENNTWSSEPIAENGAPAVAIDEEVPEPIAAPERTSARSADAPRERHVTRDYSYVRGELVKIAVIAAFLIIALMITAFFRN